MKTLLSTLALAVALVGCASSPTPKAPQNPNTQPPSIQVPPIHTVKSQKFACNNGLEPVIHHLNQDQIRLEVLSGTPTVMTIARSGSGALYVATSGIFGHGGQWHQKGDEAVFSYKNIHGVPAQINCST